MKRRFFNATELLIVILLTLGLASCIRGCGEVLVEQERLEQQMMEEKRKEAESQKINELQNEVRELKKQIESMKQQQQEPAKNEEL